MSWWSKLFQRRSMTMGMALDSAEILRLLTQGAQTNSGVSVTEESAMSVATVYSCVAVLSESVAQLPCILYQGEGDDRERARKHPLYGLLKDAPNEWMTGFEFWERCICNAGLGGNFYALKGMVGASGRETLGELFPVRKVRVKTSATGSPYYVVANEAGAERDVQPSEMLHVRYRSLDGWTGLSPIRYNAETIGLQLAGATAQARLYRNGTRLGGVLQHPGKLSADASKRLREQWEALHAGTDNAGKTAVLEEGMKFEGTTISNTDLQYIEQRKLTSTDICAIYRVPPHMVANLDRATHSNIEHSAIEFVVQTLVPWLRRIEGAVKRDLLTPADRVAGIYPEFLVEALLRGDSAARGELYKSLFATGAISSNEIRKRENMPGVGPDGDTRYVPGNLMKLGREAINADRVVAK